MMLDAPAIWLRDNCSCAECRHPGNGQKLFNIGDLAEGIRVDEVHEDDGETEAFEGSSYFSDAVALRRWDDMAKDALASRIRRLRRCGQCGRGDCLSRLLTSRELRTVNAAASPRYRSSDHSIGTPLGSVVRPRSRSSGVRGRTSSNRASTAVAGMESMVCTACSTTPSSSSRSVCGGWRRLRQHQIPSCTRRYR